MNPRTNVKIKLFGNAEPVTVNNVWQINYVDPDTGRSYNVQNFEFFAPDTRFYYIFEGDTRLHVRGSRIEYVEFSQ